MAIPQAVPSPSWARRLVSPSGVFLVLLCLFLPFVGVSCSGSMGTVDVAVSGWDMAVSGAPSVSGTGAFADGELPDSAVSSGSGDVVADGVGFQPLMLLGITAAVAAAVLGAALPTPFARTLGGLLAGAAAAALIAMNEAVVLSETRAELDTGAMMGGTVESGTRFGFWVTLALLAAMVGYHALELAMAGRPAPPGPFPPGPHQPPWPPPAPPYPPMEPGYGAPPAGPGYGPPPPGPGYGPPPADPGYGPPPPGPEYGPPPTGPGYGPPPAGPGYGPPPPGFPGPG